MMNMPLLWHIPLSHFSEKVRWALDHKRIAHNRRVLGPEAPRALARGTPVGK
jgi:glutathione S-transferase